MINCDMHTCTYTHTHACMHTHTHTHTRITTHITPVWCVCPVAWSKTHACPRLKVLTNAHTHTHALWIANSRAQMFLVTFTENRPNFSIAYLGLLSLICPSCITIASEFSVFADCVQSTLKPWKVLFTSMYGICTTWCFAAISTSTSTFNSQVRSGLGVFWQGNRKSFPN